MHYIPFSSLLFYPDSLLAALSSHSSGASEEETLSISSIIIMSSDHVNSFHFLQQDHNMKVVAWPATEKHCSQQSWGLISVLYSLWSSWRSLLNTRMVRTLWLGLGEDNTASQMFGYRWNICFLLAIFFNLPACYLPLQIQSRMEESFL